VFSLVDKELLKRMACSELAGTSPDLLKDISEVGISGETASQRLETFLSQVGNPYCFRVGKTPVRISFCEEEKPLEEKLRSYFMGLKV
jgi:hypothetical protein